MTRRPAIVLALWGVALLIAGVIALNARYVADLSGFLPAAPGETQQLLIEQIGSGPASRVLLIAIEGADEPTRLRLSRELAPALRSQASFTDVSNGELLEADGETLLRNRYVLSAAVTPDRFTAEGLKDALLDTLQSLSSPTGLALADLLPRDPTGELAGIGERLEGS
ncbi:MAG: hypothetical protein ABW136_09615, partial [Steroidobacteraceae bacterium]